LGKVTVKIYSVEEASMKYHALRKVWQDIIDKIVLASNSEENAIRFYVELLNDLFDEVTFDYSPPSEMRAKAWRKWWRRSRK